MAEANTWETLLDSAGQLANRYNTGPGVARQLTVALVHAQGEAVILGLDLGDGSSSEGAEQAALMTHLRSVTAVCAAHG